MLFLNFWEDVLKNMGAVLERMLNILWLLLCQVIYPLIATIFKIFTDIAGSLTSTGIYDGDIQTIVNRVVLILTIVMTFYIVFEFVKYTVTPDSITDKEKGAMPLFARIVIAILLLAFVPKIFPLASQFQKIVINNNVIGKIIYPQGSGNIEGLGREFAGDLFSSFIYVECNSNETSSDTKCAEAHDTANDIKNKAKSSVIIPGVDLFTGNLRIRFAGLLSVVVGCFVLYVVFLYCKDIALREIQFIFLQIFSPVAIMSYIAPKKDGLFQKWLKQCTTTYLDIFIRLAALYFMLLMINLLGTKLRYEAGDENGGLPFVYIFLIIGLMMFLKKLPKLLGELFPSSGAASIGMGFKASDRKGIFGDAWGAAKGVAARGAGAIAGGGRAIKNRKNLLSELDKNKKGKVGRLRKLATYGNAIGKSAFSGYQAGKDGKIGDAIRAGQEKAYSYETIVATGGTVLGHDYRAGHYQNVKTDIQVKVDMLKSMSDAKSAVTNAVGEIKFRKNMDTVSSTLQASGNVQAATEWEAEKKNFEKLARRYAVGEISEADYHTKAREIVDNFNSRNSTSIALDTSLLDSGNRSIYGNIATQITEASTIAKEIAKHKDITYTITEEVKDASGNPVIDPATGKVQRITRNVTMPTMDDNGQMYDELGHPIGESFAEYIGNFTDQSNEARMNLETGKEYKEAKANSEGKK